MGFMLSTANAIRALLIARAALDLTDKTCSIDLDEAYVSMINENKDRMCIVAFGGGIKESREAMTRSTGGGTLAQRGLIWKWRFNGIYMIHFTGDAKQIEEDVLSAVDELSDLMVENQRLGGLTPFADMLQVGMPDGADINDMSFYMIPFTIEVWDKR